MSKMKFILNWYTGLGKRGKILVGFAAVVLTLAAFECITGIFS